MKTEIYKFDPFAKLFIVHSSYLNVYGKFFKIVPSNIITKPVIGLSGVTWNYSYVQPNINLQERGAGIDNGTILMHIEFKDYEHTIKMLVPRKLFKKYNCDYLWVPSTWKVTNKFFFGLALENNIKILMLLPETLFGILSVQML